jgi:hypothetical protein
MSIGAVQQRPSLPFMLSMTANSNSVQEIIPQGYLAVCRIRYSVGKIARYKAYRVHSCQYAQVEKVALFSSHT